jgi:hypothetical protein
MCTDPQVVLGSYTQSEIQFLPFLVFTTLAIILAGILRTVTGTVPGAVVPSTSTLEVNLYSEYLHDKPLKVQNW